MSYIRQIWRIIYLKMIVPIIRYRGLPEHMAWGVAMGLVVGFTPTVGFQMALLTTIWVLARTAGLNFYLPAAIAWSWLSNPVTAIPLYYLFLQTGGLILGQPVLTDLRSLEVYFEELATQHDSILDSLVFSTRFLTDQGMALIVGCLPYSIGFSSIGYFATVGFILTRRKRKVRSGV